MGSLNGSTLQSKMSLFAVALRLPFIGATGPCHPCSRQSPFPFGPTTHRPYHTYTSKPVKPSAWSLLPAYSVLSAVLFQQWQHRTGLGWSRSSSFLWLHHLWHQPADEAALPWGAHLGFHKPLLGHRQSLPAHPASPRFNEEALKAAAPLQIAWL